MDAMSMAKQIEAVFSEVGQILLDPGEHEAAFARAAPNVTESVLELVEQCTGVVVPGYGDPLNNPGATARHEVAYPCAA